MRISVEGPEVVFTPEPPEKGKEHRITIPQNVREAIAAFKAMQAAGLTAQDIPIVIQIMGLMKG